MFDGRYKRFQVKRSARGFDLQQVKFSYSLDLLAVLITQYLFSLLAMGYKSMLLLLGMVVTLVEFPRLFCFSFKKHPDNPVVVFIDKNKTDVEFRWEWTHENGVLNHLKIKRYEKSKVIPTLKTLVTFYTTGGSQGLDTMKFSLDVNAVKNGYASFVIKDITNQGNNQDLSIVDVMAKDAVYVYGIELNFRLLDPAEYVNSVELKVLKTPVITKYPQNQTASEGTVTFKCAADGKPKPTITWEKIGSSENYPPGETLTLSNFDASKVGTYKCTAKSFGITEDATAVGYVQYSTCASGCDKKEFGIEMLDLTYNNEYSSPSNKKYKKLKSAIESECLSLYANKGKAIRYAEVKNFREGSVIAVVEIAYPTGTVDPSEPLLTAVKSGSFAGHKVEKEFVSPKSPPTVKPPIRLPTKPTDSATPPDSGQRGPTEGGLSKEAIIALIVVFTIIFIVILIVLIVCMLKRRKPSGSKKPYKEDGKVYDKPVSTTPLKSQPFDPMYDDPNEDRYPNGGGPPPQYTPSSYAEVRPPSNQDDSQMEWDKSVKENQELWI